MFDKYILGLILTCILSPLIGYMVYRWKSQTDTEALQERAPLEMSRQAFQTLNQNVLASNTRVLETIQKHMDETDLDRRADAEKRELHIKVLTEMVENLRSLNGVLAEMRTENRERVASLHVKIEDVKEKVLDLPSKIDRA